MTIGGAVGLAVGIGAVAVFRRARLDTAGLYPVASVAAAALSLRRGERPARLGLPGRLPRRPRARQRADPGAQHDLGLPRGARVGRADRDVPHARPARLPVAAAATSGGRARCSRWSSASSRARSRRSRRPPSGLHRYRSRRARLGRPARRGAGRARHLPGHRRRAPTTTSYFNIVFFAVVISTMLQGVDLRAAGEDARRDDRRAGAPQAPHGDRHDAGALGAEVVEYPGRRGRRDRRAATCASSGCRATRC